MFDATRIAPYLYQGSAPPEGSAVRDGGFDILMLCAEEHQPSGSRFPGVHVVHAPLDDGFLPPDEWRRARRAGAVVARAVRSGYRVLVTCAMGRNRSGLVVALALIDMGVAPENVIARIQRKRDGALTNPHFVRALRRVDSEVYA